ncbi:MAG TPA: glycosyltransferase family 9 protein [Pyrinomonadaceae bacterium]|nr:glycosyltransferase family 9 protein [Pyrinomonadaceae bacterium]
MSFDPRNILVIDFGQLGDVVLSLPALSAIRVRFPRARITVAVGKSCAPVVEMSGYANKTLAVDRVGLRDGPKPLSIWKIIQIVKAVRREQFDFVIDLHSLSETNLLGFLSGAPKRLYARRPNRSLDFLANFSTRPPVEDQKRHAVDRYLDVLAPLGVKDAPRVPKLKTRAEDNADVERMLKKEKADAGTPLVGLFPGAGHPSRRWPLERFAELADSFVRNDGLRVIVFAGPEEQSFIKEVRTKFPRNAIIFDRLTLPQLASALARLSVLVSNDTGPMHIAAAVGTSVTLLLDGRAPESYLPVEGRHNIVRGGTIDEVTTDEVYAASRELLVSERMASLFAS